jgi:hypothetical protein
MLALACTVPAVTATPLTVFFYNPETSVDNFAALKAGFDTFLSRQGNYSFQPFSDRATFEKTLQDKPAGVYMVSSWHYALLNEKIPLNPVLVGMARGEVAQRKALTSRQGVELAALREATVAGSGTEDYLRTLLGKMLADASLVSGLRLLTVPKDIDALMAVGFGMAQAAISSEASLNKLALVNARQHSQLRTLASSDKNLLLIAAIPRQARADNVPLIRIIESMNQQPEGETNLKMLGLDGWKRVETLEPALSRSLR